MRYIIGSGPAGIACACALVNQGHEVTILDAGIELEPQRQEVVKLLSQQPPGAWKKSLLDVIKEGMSLEGKGVPLKYVYGSDFPYRETEKYIPMQAEEVENIPSLAKAGLSNVWGAGLLPFLPVDIAEWPISIDDLAPHYEAVFSFLPLAAVKDDLAAIYPLYSNHYQTLKPSRQAVALMADLQRHRHSLESQGFKFGYSRLAVRTEPSSQDAGCVYCGLCMYGCPYGLIYNTASTLTELQRQGKIQYIKDVIVNRVLESRGIVKISAESRLTGELLTFEAERVYLACGVLPTTKILLESLAAYEQKLLIKDSQYFLLPLLRYRRTKNVAQEKLHTLQQVFLEIFDKELSANTTHLAIYTYNEMYESFFQQKLGKFYPLLKFATDRFLDRMIIAQGYLHSHLSPSISVSLQPGKPGNPSKLILSAKQNSQTQKTLQKLVRKLWRNRQHLQAIPISPMMRIAKAGRSFHIGGSFPMKANPKNFETDILGRPAGLQNIHVVDATVFPSIPATTITLTVMANAHRIGTNS
jgi:choline dehydrogenase-like flavoprotein